MRSLIATTALLAAFGASAATVKTATQPWVEAKIDAAVKDTGKVQSVNSQTGAVVLAASDVGVGLTNGVITIDGERIAPLTAHQSLADYAKTEDVDKKVAAQGAYTTAVSNKLETAIADEASARSAADASLSAYVTGVSNKVVAAQSAADEAAASVEQEAKARADADDTIADAIADEKKAREDAGYLTAETDPSTGLTNGTAYVRGKQVISEHQSLDAYLKTADLASKETDPTVPDWAKAGTKPTYTASEVGTYTTSEIDSKIPVISAANATFSSAVLAVGLNIDTNSVAVLNELAKDFGGFPLSAGQTATTVGGLLAALAAGLAALKKTVSTLSTKVDDANAALEEVA